MASSRTAARVARGSLQGRWRARDDGSPNLRGSLVLETAMPAGARLWVSGWTKTIGGHYGAEFVSLSATVTKPRGRQRRRRRATEAEYEPEGKFTSIAQAEHMEQMLRFEGPGSKTEG